jgi:hypothetical protein
LTWLNTLLSPNGFLFHLVGIVALSVLLAVGVNGVSPDFLWGGLTTLLGITVGTGTVTLASQSKEAQ